MDNFIKEAVEITIKKAKKYNTSWDRHFFSPFSEDGIEEIKKELKELEEKFSNIFATKTEEEIIKIMLICLYKWEEDSSWDWNTKTIFYNQLVHFWLKRQITTDFFKTNFENF